MSSRITKLLAALVALLYATSAAAILTSPIGRRNETRPSPDPGWDYFCRLRGSNQLQAVYIGGGWVIGATHVGAPQDCEIGGVTYPYVAGSLVQFFNKWDPLFQEMDISMWRISPYPSLPDLPIASVDPANGTQFTIMASAGVGTASSEVLVSGTRCLQGTGGNTQAWGHCTMAGTVSFNGFARPSVYQCNWDIDTADDAMATYGDSGSPVFHQENGTWVLTGIASALAGGPAGINIVTQACVGEYLYLVPAASFKDAIEFLRSNVGGTYFGNGITFTGGSGP